MQEQKNTQQMKKLRDSNMELLRIFSMFLVLVYHANFLSFGVPTAEDAVSSPFMCFGRLSLESFCNVCVNVFILISGWYGIKPKWNRGLEFLFQVVFIMAVTLCVNCVAFGHHLCLNDIKDLLLLNDVMWFPKSYLLLYCMAPILNAFVEKTEKRLFAKILICFFLFQFAYGWLCGGVGWFMGGYSTISFIGLYLLARYCRLYPMKWMIRFSASVYLLACLCVSLIVALGWFVFMMKEIDASRWLQAYNSPFVILQSVLLLLAFNKLSFHSKIINWTAASCFAVYVFHCSPGMLNKYVEVVNSIHDSNNTFVFLILLTLFIVMVFYISILIDKVRIAVWRRIYR